MLRRVKLAARLRSARQDLQGLQAVFARPTRALARRKAVAIHGFTDCRVACAFRDDERMRGLPKDDR